MTQSAMRDWERAARPLAIRVTLLTAGVTVLIGLCLLAANSLLHSAGQAQVSLPGRTLTISSPGLAIPLAVGGLVLWALLGSLSRLMVARQVRSHLVQRAGAQPADAGADEETGGPGLMTERLLLEAYLAQWGLSTRLVVLSVLLLGLLPWPARAGLVVVAIVLFVIVRRRVESGRQVYATFRAATQASRQGILTDLVAAIYDREVTVQRLHVSDVLLLAATTLGLVLVPMWLLQGGSIAVTSVWVILLFQSVLSLATVSATLGWREEAFFGPPLYLPLATPPERVRPVADVRQRPLQGSVFITSAPNVWPSGDAVVLRATQDSPLLLVAGSGQYLGGVRATVLASVLDQSGSGLVSLNPDRSDDALAVLMTIPNLRIEAIVLPPAHATLGQTLHQTWPQADVIVLPDDAALHAHLNGGVGVPGLDRWLGPARGILPVSHWRDEPYEDAAVHIRAGEHPKSTWVCVLDSHMHPPAGLQALATVTGPDIALVGLCDLSGAGFRDGVPPLGDTIPEVVGALRVLLDELPPVDTVLATRRGAATAVVVAAECTADRLILLNPEGIPDSDTRLIAQTQVHASSRAPRRMESAQRWSTPAGTFVEHDTGAADLLVWLYRRKQLGMIMRPDDVMQVTGPRAAEAGDTVV